MDYLEKHSIFFHKIFSKFYLWNGEEIPSSRLVTLHISGVLFLIRDGSMFDKIGSQFGDVIQKSAFSWQNEDNASGSVKIATSILSKINEAVVIKWNQKSVLAWVSESCEQNDVVPEDMEDVEEGEIRQNVATDFNNQANVHQPGMVGVVEPMTGGDVSSPVEVGESPEFQSTPEGQKSGCVHENVEMRSLHGEKEHSAQDVINIGGNGNKLNLSTENSCEEVGGTNNFKSDGYPSGPNIFMGEGGPTPGVNLGKRKRDERSPPSFGSIQVRPKFPCG
ncbi:hypothetical protein Hanom_Chr07g00669801 [Helianthus anomalus]